MPPRAEPDAGADRRYVVEAADAALRLLLLVGRHPGSSVSELGRLAEIKKPRAFRLLATLELAGFVERDARGFYALGPAARALGALAGGAPDLPRLAQPHLDALCRETGETAQLRVLRDQATVCIAKAESPHPIRVHAEVGVPRPLHVGSGKALLAFAADDLLEAVLSRPLQRYTANTLADAVQLRRELATIRRRGYAVSRGELIEGALSLSAPIFDAAGNVVASVALVGIEARMRGRVDACAAALLRTAEQIGAALGRSAEPAVQARR